MSTSLLCPPSSALGSNASAASIGIDSGEDALRRLSEFLSAIAINAAGDPESASLSLSTLGEPPAANAAALPPASSVSPYSSLADEPSPINIMVMKLRAARLAREQKRMQLAAQDGAALLVALPGAASAAAAAAAAAAMEDSARLDHRIPEVHQVSPKNPRNLREEAMLRRFDQSRLRRWWDWHDRQMQLLKEAKVQKQRRRQFLSNLRTHAWINNTNVNNASNNNSSNASAMPNTLNSERREPVDEIKRRKNRALSLSKLRIDPASGDTTAAEDALLSPPASPAHEQSVADALTQRRDSISKLRARSPSTATSPRSSFAYVIVRSRSAEDHRARLVGAHSGALESQTVDYWAQWDAQEMLVEQRETLRTQMDAVIAPDSTAPTFKPRNLRRIIAQRAFLDEECAW
ncbi:hypothetical protein BDZ88DRAFT_280239 [Geranomyces variabilis]|nr:hypothetical protein BDZ88DRAFT_280239 [Geranomyces variabilis]KAJ3142362.1 hypothetical protein HDU90_004635 [Geranomyces variabilis]